MAHLYEVFPDFDPSVEIDEDAMKSKEGKEKWRNFMMKYEKTVDDYNFGTLLRRRPDVEYEEKTTMFAPRMQVSTSTSLAGVAGLHVSRSCDNEGRELG